MVPSYHNDNFSGNYVKALAAIQGLGNDVVIEGLNLDEPGEEVTSMVH